MKPEEWQKEKEKTNKGWKKNMEIINQEEENVAAEVEEGGGTGK